MTGAIACAVAFGVPAVTSAPAPLNPIQAENAKPGTPGWLLPLPPTRTAIAGYSLSPSVAPGGRLRIAVSTTPAARYTVKVYRLGWYAGIGARRVACVPGCGSSEQGTSRPDGKPNWVSGDGVVVDHWPVTDTLAVGRDWTSGYYLAELVLASGPARGTASVVPFIVRPPAGDRSAILVQAPVNTWQAYNDWGGTSLYGPGNTPASKASFDRPYAPNQQSPLFWEYPLVRFLERGGYEVGYVTDVDVDAQPQQLLRHRLIIVPGHSEYWTERMFDALQGARDAGVNLAFVGGNDGYWQSRYDATRRTIIEYRGRYVGQQPGTANETIRFRDLAVPQPECSLVGVEWQGGWIGDSLDEGGVAVVTTGDSEDSLTYTVHAPALNDPWFRGTGFTAGATLPGIVGYEWDAVQPGCLPSQRVLFHYQGVPYPNPYKYTATFTTTSADATKYTAPSGATVFAAGSIEFSWGLDGFAQKLNHRMGFPDQAPPDPRLQRFMTNVLDDLSQPKP